MLCKSLTAHSACYSHVKLEDETPLQPARDEVRIARQETEEGPLCRGFCQPGTSISRDVDLSASNVSDSTAAYGGAVERWLDPLPDDVNMDEFIVNLFEAGGAVIPVPLGPSTTSRFLTVGPDPFNLGVSGFCAVPYWLSYRKGQCIWHTSSRIRLSLGGR